MTEDRQTDIPNCVTQQAEGASKASNLVSESRTPPRGTGTPERRLSARLGQGVLTRRPTDLFVPERKEEPEERRGNTGDTNASLGGSTGQRDKVGIKINGSKRLQPMSLHR